MTSWKLTHRQLLERSFIIVFAAIVLLVTGPRIGGAQGQHLYTLYASDSAKNVLTTFVLQLLKRRFEQG